MIVVDRKPTGRPSLVAQAFAQLERGVKADPGPKLVKIKGKPPAKLEAEAYRRLVSIVPCRYPGCKAPPPSQPCHLNYGKGKATKVSDAKIGAGCPEHHRMVDQGKELNRPDRRDILNIMCIETFTWLMERGHIGIVENS